MWFVNAAAEIETSVAFPMLVKPIFPSSGGTDDPFTLRVDEHGCRVEGLKLGPTRSACFGATAPLGNKFNPATLEHPLSGAVLVRGGQARFLGDLAAGVPIPTSAQGENPVHRSPGYDAWNRFVGKDALFGVLSQDATPSRELESPDLADEREGSRYFLLKLK